VLLYHTKRSRRAYRKLSKNDKPRVDRALRLLVENPHHPGLRVKAVQGSVDVWEARASDAIRLTFEMQGDMITLRNIGRHDEVLRNP